MLGIAAENHHQHLSLGITCMALLVFHAQLGAGRGQTGGTNKNEKIIKNVRNNNNANNIVIRSSCKFVIFSPLLRGKNVTKMLWT